MKADNLKIYSLIVAYRLVAASRASCNAVGSQSVLEAASIVIHSVAEMSITSGQWMCGMCSEANNILIPLCKTCGQPMDTQFWKSKMAKNVSKKLHGSAKYDNIQHHLLTMAR